MGGRRPRTAVEPAKKRRIWLGLLDQGIWLFAVAAVLSLTYLMFILMSGGLAAQLIAGSALDAVRRNVDIARQVFLWALWLGILAVCIRHYRAEATGYMTLAIGALLWLGFPVLVRSKVPGTSARDLVDLATSMIESFQTSGGALMVLGILRAVIGRVILVSTAPRSGAITRNARFASAMAQISEEPIGGRASLMRKCWELHFCRGSLRVHCPRYLDQRACWKARSGCYCDQGLATRLLDTVGSKVKVQVAEEMQSVQSHARQAAKRPGTPPTKQKARRRPKPPCGGCPIYLEHQKFKYRVLSWLAYPAAAAVVGMVLTPIRDGYQYLDQYLGSVLAGAVAAVPYAQPIQEAQWMSAENAAIILVGVMNAATILQLTEAAVFRFKL